MAVVGLDLQGAWARGPARVATARVMPRVPSSNTNAPTIMVGEKGADIIRRPHAAAAADVPRQSRRRPTPRTRTERFSDRCGPIPLYSEGFGAGHRMFQHATGKIRRSTAAWDPLTARSVYTVKGRYTSRGWTEWTQGFQFGSALLVYDATGDADLLQMGKQRTLDFMAPHT